MYILVLENKNLFAISSTELRYFHIMTKESSFLHNISYTFPTTKIFEELPFDHNHGTYFILTLFDHEFDAYDLLLVVYRGITLQGQVRRYARGSKYR